MLKKTLYTLFVLMVGVISLNAKTEITDRDITTAIQNGLPSTKELLTKVPIDYINEKDDTLLHYAVRFRKQRVVEYLINQGVLISRKGGLFYGTALGEAIYYGHLGIASYLIDKGSLLNIQNKYGETPLHIATKNGYLDIVEQLLESGASKTIADSSGNIPYDLIPDLSWDSKSRLKELLKVKKEKTSRLKMQTKSFRDKSIFIGNIGDSNLDSKRNSNLIRLHKTKIEGNSNIGIDINMGREIDEF